jgi:hypothetical protein
MDPLINVEAGDRTEIDYVKIRSYALTAVPYVDGMDNYAFLSRCPTTGHKVQGLVRGNTRSTDGAYETVTCLACKGVHLVNPNSGRVLGADPFSDQRFATPPTGH